MNSLELRELRERQWDDYVDDLRSKNIQTVQEAEADQAAYLKRLWECDTLLEDNEAWTDFGKSLLKLKTNMSELKHRTSYGYSVNLEYEMNEERRLREFERRYGNISFVVELVIGVIACFLGFSAVVYLWRLFS